MHDIYLFFHCLSLLTLDLMSTMIDDPKSDSGGLESPFSVFSWVCKCLQTLRVAVIVSVCASA